MVLRFPWPAHWQGPNGAVRCVVPGCDFLTSGSVESERMEDLKHHCQLLRGEHTILLELLRQIRCVYNGCSYECPKARGEAVKQLFHHEETEHDGGATMSHIDSFIVLVREGRIPMTYQGDLKQAIFARMELRLRGMDDERRWIYWASGFPEPKDHTDENLAGILRSQHPRPATKVSPPWQPVPVPPFWEPILAGDFLMNIKPVGDYEAAKAWGLRWDHLRLLYREGKI